SLVSSEAGMMPGDQTVRLTLNYPISTPLWAAGLACRSPIHDGCVPGNAASRGRYRFPSNPVVIGSPILCSTAGNSSCSATSRRTRNDEHLQVPHTSVSHEAESVANRWLVSLYHPRPDWYQAVCRRGHAWSDPSRV